MALKFIEANEHNKINRIWGDELEELIKEATSHINRDKTFFEERFREVLPVIGSTLIAPHSTRLKAPIRVYYDPLHQISQEDLINLDGSEMLTKYAKFHS